MTRVEEGTDEQKLIKGRNKEKKRGKHTGKRKHESGGTTKEDENKRASGANDGSSTVTDASD